MSEVEKKGGNQAEMQSKGVGNNGTDKDGKKKAMEYIPRLQKHYHEKVVPAMMEKFGYKNPLEVPRIWKIVVNMGVGRWRDESGYIDEAIRDLALITGQKPALRKARKSIAGFHVRRGDTVGLTVTLRRKMMYDFFDRLINIAMPRAKDFKGFFSRGFDGKGNYNIGIKEHTIFPEVPYTKIKYVKGMTVTIVTTAETDEEAKELLRLMGMPFRD